MGSASVLSKKWNIPLEHALLATDLISPDQYARIITDAFRIEFIHAQSIKRPLIKKSCRGRHRLLKSALWIISKDGRYFLCLPAEILTPQNLSELLVETRTAGLPVAITTRAQLTWLLSNFYADPLASFAVNGLEKKFPGESVGHSTRPKLVVRFARLLVPFFLGLVIVAPPDPVWIALPLTIIFQLHSVMRLLACRYCSDNRNESGIDRIEQSEQSLPIYTILVPLYREANMLQSIIYNLQKLDYPPAKLDIKLILEEDDTQSLSMLSRMTLPSMFELIVVPPAYPQTKPKALNYALTFARGAYLVVYDAEDQPEPDQLKNAVRLFRRSPLEVACLQARLSFYNMHENWLTRQFAIEYAALFHGILPLLQKLGLPMPLGGTSNHFRVPFLRSAGGWDAFNVTEDADLGIRLYKQDFKILMLDSTTYEEATTGIPAWFRQRTRWLKGWMQTYIVHMRNPLDAIRELRLKGFLGLQLIFACILASAFVYPWVCAYLLWQFVAPPVISDASHFGYDWFLMFCLANLGFSLFASMCLGLTALRSGNHNISWVNICALPIYWMLISVAVYRAFIQLFVSPSYWEKTEHGVSCQMPIYKNLMHRK